MKAYFASGVYMIIVEFVHKPARRQRRAVQRGVTEDDGCAVFIRRRVVNAYCRANPR